MAKTLTVYTLAQCSTCKKATAWLRSRGIEFTEKAIRQTPPSVPELKAMLAAYDGQIRRLFNTSGIEYREQGLATQLPTWTEDEALRRLATNGSLVKRPFLLGAGVAVVGFDEDRWADALKRG